MLQLIRSLTHAILRDVRLRRGAMLRLMGAALGMLAVGFLLFGEHLAAHPLAFILWWGACAWLTLAAALLALFDLLLVRTAARAARQRLERDMLRAAHPTSTAPSHDPVSRNARGN